LLKRHNLIEKDQTNLYWTVNASRVPVTQAY